MGTWIGHIAPGVFFILFALWWHINNCVRYLKSLCSEEKGKTREDKIKFRGSTTYPCECLGFRTLRELPMESILKIIITTIHFTIELITGYYRLPKPHIGDENAHHTMILFGFFLGSWVEILVYYKFSLPKRITQVMGFLAFAIEGFMMLFHLHARTLVDGHIHVLLGLTAVFSMISAAGECFDPDNFWFIVARSFFALTQGTWLIQAAYIIWPTTTNPLFVWDSESHRSVSLLTMSYAYHLGGNAVILISVYLLICIIFHSICNLNIDDTNDEDIICNCRLIISANDEEDFA